MAKTKFEEYAEVCFALYHFGYLDWDYGKEDWIPTEKGKEILNKLEEGETNERQDS
jgi:hypothetical protein